MAAGGSVWDPSSLRHQVRVRRCALLHAGRMSTRTTGRVFPAAVVYLLALSFPKVNSDRRYLEVDSELRREASCLRGGSWVSNVSRGEINV